MSDFTDALTGVGLNLASGLINTGVQYATSKKLMDYQNKLNIQNWKMANEYNSPSAQMARYKAAGLNPNLVYGSLGQTAAGNISSPSASGINPRINFGSSIADYQIAAQQRKVLQAQEKNMLLNNDQISANIRKTDAETKNIETNTRITEDFYPLKKEAQGFANQMAKFGVDKVTAESKYFELNAALDYQLKVNQTVLQQDKHVLNLVEKLERETNVSKAKAEIALIGAKVLLTRAQTSLTYAQEDLTYANKELTIHQIPLTDAKVKNLAKEFLILDNKLKMFPLEQRSQELKNMYQAIENTIYAGFGRKEAEYKIGPLEIGPIVWMLQNETGKRGFFPIDTSNFK